MRRMRWWCRTPSRGQRKWCHWSKSSWWVLVKKLLVGAGSRRGSRPAAAGYQKRLEGAVQGAGAAAGAGAAVQGAGWLQTGAWLADVCSLVTSAERDASRDHGSASWVPR